VWAQYYEKLATIEDFTLCLLNDQSFFNGSAGVKLLRAALPMASTDIHSCK